MAPIELVKIGAITARMLHLTLVWQNSRQRPLSNCCTDETAGLPRKDGGRIDPGPRYFDLSIK